MEENQAISPKDLRGMVIESATVKKCLVITGLRSGNRDFAVAANLLKEEKAKKLYKLVELRIKGGEAFGRDYEGDDENAIIGEILPK